MSRNEDSESLKDVIQNLFQSNQKLETKYVETKVPTIWKEVVGTFIYQRTEKVYVKNQKLFVHLSSAPLKHEMMHNRDKVIKLINEKLGQDYIQELIIN